MKKKYVLIILSLTLLASCRGDKRDTSLTQGSIKPSPSAQEFSPLAPSSEEAETKPTSADPGKIESSTNVPAEAVKRLSKILNLEVTPQTPFRMEGPVITNNNFQESLQPLINDNLLLGLLSPNFLSAQKNISSLASEKKLKVDFTFKARLIPISELQGASLKEEAKKALDSLLANPENYQEALVPISINLSVNFYDKKSPVIPRLFYAQMNIENGKFLGFKLLGRQAENEAHLTLPSSDTMIVYFKESFLNVPTERIAVMHFEQVNPQPN